MEDNIKIFFVDGIQYCIMPFSYLVNIINQQTEIKTENVTIEVTGEEVQND